MPFKPSFMHLHPVKDLDELPLFLYGSILTLSPLSEWETEMMAHARRKLLSNPFFENGLGDVLTHSVYKCKNPDPKISISSFWLDLSSMEVKHRSPNQLNEQLRCELRTLPETELRELTEMAIRRLRVRREHAQGLSNRFISGLRQKR